MQTDGGLMASSISIPKVIRKVSEKKFGRTWRWIWITVLSIGFIVIMLMLSNFVPWRAKPVIWALVIAYIVFFFKFLKSDETLDRSILMWNYFMRSMRGQTIIAKYKCSVPFLQQIVPIVAVHPQGIIEFVGGRFGVLMKIDPSRISDDDLDTHIMKVKDVVDSLYSDIILKTYVCSRSDRAKPMEQQLVKKMNDPNLTQEQKQHLYSLYEESRKNTKPVVEWQFYCFISIGHHENIENAERARQAHIPGLENRMRAAEMHIVPLVDSDDIALAYRQMFTQIKL